MSIYVIQYGCYVSMSESAYARLIFRLESLVRRKLHLSITIGMITTFWKKNVESLLHKYQHSGVRTVRRGSSRACLALRFFKCDIDRCDFAVQYK